MLNYLDNIEEKRVRKINEEIDSEDTTVNPWKFLCVICGERVTVKHYLCRECSKEYGDKASDRPEWVNFLINDEARDRKNELRHETIYIPNWYFEN